MRDSGELHRLLGVGSYDALLGHSRLGASWEGFALEQVLNVTGAESDLMLLRRGKRHGVGFKCADAPVTTESLHIALADLKLEWAWIVYPGTENHPCMKGRACARQRAC